MTVTRLLSFAALFIGVVPVSAQEWKTEFTGYFGGQVSRPLKEVRNIPISARTVPIHKDDEHIARCIRSVSDPRFCSSRPVGSGSSTIPDTSSTVDRLTPTFTFALLARRKYSRHTFGAGISYDVPTLNLLEADEKRFEHVREWDYLNDDASRGSGSALAYFTPQVKRMAWMPGLILEVERNFSDSVEGPFLVLGYRMTPYRVVIETGWDRFDELEQYLDHDLALSLAHNAFVGIGASDCNETKCFGFRLGGGPEFHSNFKTDLGRQVSMNTGLPWRVSFQLFGNW